MEPPIGQNEAKDEEGEEILVDGFDAVDLDVPELDDPPEVVDPPADVHVPDQVVAPAMAALQPAENVSNLADPPAGAGPPLL